MLSKFEQLKVFNFLVIKALALHKKNVFPIRLYFILHITRLVQTTQE